jgi:hypothetical protein
MSTWQQNVRQLKRIQEQQVQKALLEEIFLSITKEEGGSSSSLMPIVMAGQAKLPLATRGNNTSSAAAAVVTMLVLTPDSDLTSQNKQQQQVIAAILVPLAFPESQLKLLSFANAKQSLSSLTLLLSLNTLLVNRDGSLFDNLPWSTWSIDPQRRNRDAAGNPIEEKYHLGKRDAYNRFMGKDWPGRSLALGNMAMRLQYMMENKNNDQAEDAIQEDVVGLDSSNNQVALTKRILEVRIRELQMELAEAESQLAIARNNPQEFTEKDVNELERLWNDLAEDLETTRGDLELLAANDGIVKASTSSGITSRISKWAETDANKAPYRGAMGYAPMIDSQEDMEQTFLDRSYRSPYDLLVEILDDQLNAKVIGCVLENTSLIRGNLVLGGALVIQRNVATKRARLAGEDVEYLDPEETFGNEGVAGGEFMVVECDVDEAVGVSLATDLPLRVEQSIFDRASVTVELIGETEQGPESSIRKKRTLPAWKVDNSSTTVQVEGDSDSSRSASQISIPRTTASLYEPFLGNRDSSNDGPPKPLYPTENPIKSLEQLDGLDNEAKAKTLLEMSNFRGTLPRPRVVRNAPTNDNPLDKLLLPLIDETVRKQYLVRQAEQNGDVALVEQLKASKSQLQIAREKAAMARLDENEELAQYWEKEVRFLETLRADVTQDVGSYSRFLDRDDWYERDRQQTAKRTKKSSFGNLLDGIE